MAPPAPAPGERLDTRTLRSLANDASAGDRGAFDEIHRRLTPGLRRLLQARTSATFDGIDDLLQRTWMHVWRALSEGKYDPERSAITTFTYAVGHKVWLQHLRQAPRHAVPLQGAPGEADERADESDDPADAVRLAEQLDTIRAALRDDRATLTEDERWMLRQASEGASDRQLARELGLAPSTVNARKRTALEKLRRWLQRSGRSQP